MRLTRLLLPAIFALVGFATPVQAESAAATPAHTPALVIGSGAVTGIYFPTAGAVQRLVNDQNAGVNLAVQSTNGSIANLQALANGGLDLAIAQSDWAYYASKGGMPPFVEANADLRVLLALHAELLAIVVKADSNINDLDGLKGRKINLGPTGSGPRNLMTAVFQTLNWGVGEMGALLDLPFADQAGALCSGQVDAIVYLVPHPNAAVQDALTRCATKLLPLNGRAVDQLIANNPFYSKSVIPGNSYTGQATDVPTFGVRALLMSTAKLPDSVAYAVAKAAYSNVAQLNVLHPSLARLTAADMKPTAYGLPLHPGVEKYLAEAGLMTAAPAP